MTPFRGQSLLSFNPFLFINPLLEDFSIGFAPDMLFVEADYALGFFNVPAH